MIRARLRLSPLGPALLGDSEHGGVVAVVDAEATVGGVDDSLKDETDTEASRVAWVDDQFFFVINCYLLTEKGVDVFAFFLRGVDD
jgi:hypothetical protein